MTDLSPRRLDLVGLKCPLPALKTRKALKELASGERIAVVCTDPLSEVDIPNLVRETCDILEETRREGDQRSFIIRKA
jgi:tRNA 2-thiouridine synthesizing protein A